MVEGEGATFFGRTFLSPASEIPTYSSLSKLPLLFLFTQITALEPSNRLTLGSINGLPVSEQVIGRLGRGQRYYFYCFGCLLLLTFRCKMWKKFAPAYLRS
jgi:hypothetical protein